VRQQSGNENNNYLKQILTHHLIVSGDFPPDLKPKILSLGPAGNTPVMACARRSLWCPPLSNTFRSLWWKHKL